MNETFHANYFNSRHVPTEAALNYKLFLDGGHMKLSEIDCLKQR
jgi:hypothetical protein